MRLVFFLEEPSAGYMLDGVLPRLLPDNVSYLWVPFDGKQDLEKQLPRKLKGWLHTEDTRFIILRDQDGGDCKKIKARLHDICVQAGKPDVLIRIACRELESFYLGDLHAVGKGFNKPRLAETQNSRKFRNPDGLGNPIQELERLVPEYEKGSGSRVISPHLNLETNYSCSFRALITGIKMLV
jgi:hypothetical protein